MQYHGNVTRASNAPDAARRATPLEQAVVGSTPLINAIIAGDKARSMQLIKAGVDPNDPGALQRPPVYWAALDADMLPVLRALVEHGAAVNPSCRGGFTPLHRACEGGSPAEAEYLITMGANTRAREECRGYTPLHLAVFAGRPAGLVDILLAHGGVVNALDDRGETPLDVAIMHENEGAARRLRAHGGRLGKDLVPATQAVAAGASSG
jgi:ankyrin repeat protein